MPTATGAISQPDRRHLRHGRRRRRRSIAARSPRLVQKRVPLYDKSQDGHYNLISALHKSVRGSDPDAALYYLARMLAAGENPLYLARRLVRMAIEDIGLADPRGDPAGAGRQGHLSIFSAARKASWRWRRRRSISRPRPNPMPATPPSARRCGGPRKPARCRRPRSSSMRRRG